MKKVIFFCIRKMFNGIDMNFFLLVLYYMLNAVICAHAGILDTTEPTFGLSQSANQERSLSPLGSSGCGMTCITLDSLGPPPDTILTIPPPPVPAFLQEALLLNKSDNESCNMCHLFGTSNQESSDSVTRHATKLDDSWVPVLVIVGTGSAVIGALLMIFLLKCKKWKIFPVAADSCPILPESFHSHKHTSPIQSKVSENAVVSQKVKDINEEIQKNSLKYLPRGSSQERPCSGHCSVGSGCQRCAMQDPSYTSGSPLYTELEVSPSQKYMISGAPKLGFSPYSVNTYRGVTSRNMVDVSSPDMVQKLIKGGAYDNEAFLASEGSRTPVIQSQSKLINHTSRITIEPHEYAPVLSLPTLSQESRIQTSADNEKCLERSMINASPQTSRVEPLFLNGVKIPATATADFFLRSGNLKSSFLKAGEMCKRPLPKHHV